MKIKGVCILLLLVVFLNFAACSIDEYIDDETQLEKDETQINDEDKSPETLHPVSEDDEQKNLLSNSCQYVIASGYDSENNYYELVANETENYMGAIVEIGVIKNNEWSITLTSKSPFNEDNGLLLSNNTISDVIEDGDIEYVGSGCFAMYSCLWNGNTGDYFYSDEWSLRTNYYVNKEKYTIINNDGMFLFAETYYDDDEEDFCLLNSNTMSTEIIAFDDSFLAKSAACAYSEGKIAFLGADNYSKNGFYDLNGTKLIDLSQYDIEDSYLAFNNGTCSFRIKNDAGAYYVITIDETGEVVSSKKVI